MNIPEDPNSAGDSGTDDEGPSEETLRAIQEELDRLWPRRGPGVKDRIGRFEVAEELGRGGFGVVLRAHDPILGLDRALKVPNPAALESPAALARFLSECKALAKVDHPNIVKIYETDRSGPVWYMVMELCSGGSLADRLGARADGPPVPARVAARLCAEIAEGVAHAHAAGVLHRDLKPGNILLVPRAGAPAGSTELGDHLPKVADFGLAKLILDDESQRTDPNSRLGTLAYMAPELAERMKTPITGAVDVYGVGVILYEILTGRRPHRGESHAALLDSILHHEPEPLRKLRPDVPADLDAVCRACLMKSPADRYKSAGDLALDLRRFLDGEPVPGRPQPLFRRIRRWVRARPKAVGTAAAAAFALAVWLAVSSMYARWWNDQAVETWMEVVAGASPASLPKILPKFRADDPRVAAKLAALADSAEPGRKRNATVALARIDPARRPAALRLMLDAPPDESVGLAQALRDAPGFVEELETLATTAAPGPPAEAEARDRDRAAAASALLRLGRESTGWGLLRFRPDPQARSFLIHRLGSSGLPARVVLDRLDVEPDVSARRALLLALGRYPDDALAPEREAVERRAAALYRADPDPGVHGAAKWLLRTKFGDETVRALDAELAALPPDESRGWRIGPLGLTFVRVEDSEGRAFEVSDTELTVAQAEQFNVFNYLQRHSPTPEHPLNSASAVGAAEFLNWLSARDGIAPEEFSYRAGDKGRNEPPFVPTDPRFDRGGYRLMTDREFETACRAGTVTSRHFGDTDAILASYARHDPRNGLVADPVGRSMPNDLGLFDMLGNVAELCHLTDENVDPNRPVVYRGGSIITTLTAVNVSTARGPYPAVPNILGDDAGIRVARTVRPRK